MKKILTLSVALAFSAAAFAQDPAEAIDAAAQAIAGAPDTPEVVVKPNYWTNSLKTNINVNQTGLTNWAAGGDNTYTMSGYVDGNANYKKDKVFFNNRLQLNYGFIYADSKPIFQKNTDQIKFESKYGHNIKDKWSLTADFTFISQFTDGYNYKTPGADLITKYGGAGATNLDELTMDQQKAAWKEARVVKSGFLSPANATLGLGVGYVPNKWLSMNFAPLTGGLKMVTNPELRKNYGMDLLPEYAEMADDDPAKVAAIADGSAYKQAQFELGAQFKADVKLVINDNLSANSQLILFSNYLKKPQNLRVNWDNRIDWKLTKLFTLTIVTNLIYDDTILIADEAGIAKQRIQFKEAIGFGFSYTITNKK